MNHCRKNTPIVVYTLNMDAQRRLAFADHVATTCIGTKLRKLSRIITGIYNAALRPTGVTVGQFGIITAVLKTEPVSPIRLATLLGIERSTLSRNLELMRKNGWIDMAGKGRGLLVSLTPRGARAYDDCVVPWQAAQRKAQKIVKKVSLKVGGALS